MKAYYKMLQETGVNGHLYVNLELHKHRINVDVLIQNRGANKMADDTSASALESKLCLNRCLCSDSS